MTQGGISLLSMTAANGEDPQTLRMVAGAIANLCGNGKLADLFNVQFLNHILNHKPHQVAESRIFIILHQGSSLYTFS